MKRIVVTGGAGRLGRTLITDLLSRQYDVLAVDRIRPETLQCPFLEADLTDASSVYQALTGADAVVHLGAIPGPVSAPSTVTFQNNVMSTWHVADAAARLGLKRIVFASSVFTLGWHESPQVFWPEYAPVDEDHPLTPFEAYGLSKVAGEEIVAAVSRSSRIPAISLRIMNIIQTSGYFALPWPTPTPDQPVRFVLWPYVDIRDAATACRQSLEARTTGHQSLYIAAADIRFDADTEPLLRRCSPGTTIRSPMPGSASVISTENARRLIGYEARYSWKQFRSSEHA